MERDFSSELSCVLAGGADTLVARATAGGAGALAIVRLSGPQVRAITRRVCRWTSWSDRWEVGLVGVYSAADERIDQAVLIAYPRPRSFTGEDMAELVIHGSPWLTEELLASCEAAGARPAAAGEFSRRAVANGKLDVAQAEGIRDLIGAETAWQARTARLQADGVLSARVQSLRAELLAALAVVEGSLDFSGQEVAFEEARAATAVRRACRLVDELRRTAGVGRKLREGVRVVLAGRPNAGKSTAFNTLLGRDRTIVAATPGTTRDVIEVETEIGGVRVVLVDTAGLRETVDEVEIAGVERARRALAEADIVLLLWAADDPRRAPAVVTDAVVIGVRSKWDVGGADQVDGWRALSCHSGEGVAALRDELLREIGAGVADLGGEVAIAARHRAALDRAAAALAGVPYEEPELAAEHLRWALDAVGEIIGAVSSDELLDEVFSTFCLGK